VLPDAAPADQIAETILHCPTGALHFSRKDGGAAEVPDHTNGISPGVDGPLYVRGDVVIETPEGEVLLKDTRVALCRCGASKNKPFCDKSHETIGFQHNGLLGENEAEVDGTVAQSGPLRIIATKNGPFELRGPFELHGVDQTCYQGNRAFLCRCGGSSNKPFCDDTHLRIGFKSE
jgi:CDGSH-type Zn-finger protein